MSRALSPSKGPCHMPHQLLVYQPQGAAAKLPGARYCSILPQRHNIVVVASDVDSAHAVDRQAPRIIEAGEGQYNLRGRAYGEFQRPIVSAIGDVDGALAVHCHTAGIGKPGEGQRGLSARARGQCQNPIIAAIGYVDGSVVVHHGTGWSVKTSEG
jgi:hypothetical protein